MDTAQAAQGVLGSVAYTLTQILPVQGPWSKGMLRSVRLVGPRLLAMATRTLNSHLGEAVSR